ncbi:hypothetical protein ROL61_20875 [Cronobacter sakazakii]|nr:hypothetical protein [Cronobacter sakazakii]ELY2932134.1 hypothetical protein [Cronobacter sakazakii]MDT3632957.1 hypothetical protein [Cronobacter sakazakii]
MTEEFKSWFDKNFPPHLWPVEDERQEVMTYTWPAWRDSIRAAGLKVKGE